jgi:hypothetical protein
MLGSGAALGVLEQAMRAALSAAGAALLQAVLDEQDDGYCGPHAACGCGGQAVHAGSRPKTITTVLGPVTLRRAWYHCAACKRGSAPRDRQPGLLPGGTLSPGLAEMTALAGAEVSFARAGLVKAEYLRRGGEHFRQVVALGDGAAWIWTMAEDLYPHATHIVDIYHAREHLHDLAAHLAFITPDPQQWLAGRSAELDAGNITAIIDAASCHPLAGIKAGELDRKLGYFKRNAHRMRYQHFRDPGMFTGSGAIEGGIKAIVVQRAKQAGMHWTTEGAADIIALRTQHASGRWNELWPASSSTTLPAAV